MKKILEQVIKDIFSLYGEISKEHNDVPFPKINVVFDTQKGEKRIFAYHSPSKNKSRYGEIFLVADSFESFYDRCMRKGYSKEFSNKKTYSKACFILLHEIHHYLYSTKKKDLILLNLRLLKKAKNKSVSEIINDEQIKSELEKAGENEVKTEKEADLFAAHYIEKLVDDERVFCVQEELSMRKFDYINYKLSRIRKVCKRNFLEMTDKEILEFSKDFLN